jgi:hypothetical protein
MRPSRKCREKHGCCAPISEQLLETSPIASVRQCETLGGSAETILDLFAGAFIPGKIDLTGGRP